MQIMISLRTHAVHKSLSEKIPATQLWVIFYFFDTAQLKFYFEAINKEIPGNKIHHL